MKELQGEEWQIKGDLVLKEDLEGLECSQKKVRCTITNTVIRQVCGQTWTRVRVWTSIYYSDNY